MGGLKKSQLVNQTKISQKMLQIYNTNIHLYVIIQNDIFMVQIRLMVILVLSSASLVYISHISKAEELKALSH